MKQLSPEWFAIRLDRVTGSNAGAILGCDPYRGPDNVLRGMVRAHHGAESEFKGNVATQWGNANESTAQFDFTMLTGKEVQECGFFAYDEWLGASPDGLTLGGVLEIKCPFGKRKDNPVTFKSLDEQPHYYAQMQIEMLCTGVGRCYFYQWTPHGDDLTEVLTSQEWLDENIPKLRAFYDLFISEIDNPDHLEPLRKVIDTPDALLLLSEYDDLNDSIFLAEERKKDLLGELISMAKDKSALICGRKLTKVDRKGSVSYAKIVKTELPHLDLELHRGEPSTSWKLT